MRAVYIPAISKHVSLGAYCKAVRTAKARPEHVFQHGFTSWWPTTGAHIVEQFREGMHDRINQAIPYTERGIK